ncbi:MAG: preprotein translocase subunit YajC [Rikenellaceae bacterium]
MNLNFIAPLMAAPADGAAGESNLSFFVMMALVFVVMYFFMIRPQQKRQKELVKFRDSLQKGDKVVTAGGIYGVVKSITDTHISLEVDNNVSIKVDKTMIMKDLSDVVRK